MGRVQRRRAVVLGLVALVACREKAKPPPPAASASAPSASVVLAPAPKEAATTPLATVAKAPREGSTVVALADGTAIVADEDAHALLAVSTVEVTATTKLAGRPGQMIVTDDGLLAVALRDEHAIGFFGRTETGAFVEKRRVNVPDEPVALARNGKSIVSVSAIGHSVCAVAEKAKCYSVDREPRAVTVSDDGKYAVVAHGIANGASVVELESGTTSFSVLGRGKVDIEAVWDVQPMGMLRPTRYARQGFSIVRLPGEERFTIPTTLSSPGDPGLQPSGYGSADGGGSSFHPDEVMAIYPIIQFDLPILSRASLGAPPKPKAKPHRPTTSSWREGEKPESFFAESFTADSLMDHERRCFLPRAAVATGASLYVACVGSRDIQRFDIPKKGAIAMAPKHYEIGGVSGLAFDANGHLLAFSQHDRTLATFEGDKPKPAHVVTFDPKTDLALNDDARRGRALFHDSRDERISKDRRACATCHPDARDDGLTWLTADGPRQTIFLCGRLDRKPPFGWNGKHASIVEHVKNTIKQLGGTGLPGDSIRSLESYLRTIPPPPRPANPELGEEAKTGKRIFFSSETRCSTCHAESQGFGGARAEDVSSKSNFDVTKEYLVPSLRFLGASAPYYHDGRFATLPDLIRGVDGKMGHTKHLSDADVGALSAYLETL